MTTKVSDFKKELIASILDEQNKFDMREFKSGSNNQVATCKTALCMAGHIEALRPRLAKKLAAKHKFYGELDHHDLAHAIWREETGQECRLDFFADMTETSMDVLTRKDAVAHIRGRSKKWPLLPKGG